jgi:hypothetical protein
MKRPLPIVEYRDFWTILRMFLVRYESRLFLFDCEFDEEVEDFRDDFKIFLMPELSPEELDQAWLNLSRQSLRFCGCVPTASVNFDPTRREQVDAEAFVDLLEEALHELHGRSESQSQVA